MGPAEGLGVAMSDAQRAYFDRLESEAQRVLSVARAARRKGLDPSLDVEIPLAADLAARVEAQVQIPGVAQRIRELTREHKVRELVSLHAAKEVALGRFGQWPSREVALEKAVRTGLSILTEGILVAPLEGIAKVAIGTNADGTDYVDLFFAGPIRAAGGTAQAMSVLIADVVRRELNIGRFHCTQAEVERYKEEVPAYKRAQHLQYAPDGDEIELLVRQCPVCINGEGTEEEEVTGHRDLPRVETNRLRGGAVLVLAEGLSLKAPKIAKIVSQLKLPDWGFLEAFVRKAAEPKPDTGDEVQEIEASDKFIKELIGGRPVLAHPSRIGGFRLRYGRSRTAGIASTSVSPLAMYAMDEFLAVGTQMKIERPGKGTIATPCSGLEGPILLLKNGDLVQPETHAELRECLPAVSEITDLGEILIPFGEFNENNALLPDASFALEWWQLELEAAAAGEAPAWAERAPTFAEALDLSRRLGIPLHPAHNLFWHDITWEDFGVVCRGLDAARVVGGVLVVPLDAKVKAALVTLGALHRATPEGIIVERRWEALLACTGHRVSGESVVPVERRDDALAVAPKSRFPVVAGAAAFAGVPIRPRAPTRVGARMGRPEKADVRAMDPPVHVLFPVGHDGGSQRSIDDAAAKGSIRVKVASRRCPSCGREAFLVRCTCGARTEPTGRPPSERDLPLREEYALALQRLKGIRIPKKLKGVQGLISEAKLAEPLEKGLLRAARELWVFKDGTIRFDATDAPLTHFRPDEVGTDVRRLHELGYVHDAKGAPLERPDQVVELRVQDIVLPQAAGRYFVQTAQFLDDLLERFYGLPPFYQVREPRDLVGHLVAGLAPHTSGAVLGRIIGFTKANVAYAHPFYHTAKRRNCVAGDTQIFVFNSPTPTRRGFAELWDNAPGRGDPVDAFGTLAKPGNGLQVFAVNPKTGRVELKPILRLYRSPAPRHMVRLQTQGGRSVDCTADHPVLLGTPGGVLRRAAVQSARAPLAVAVARPFEPAPSGPVDLVDDLISHGATWAVVRGARDWLMAAIQKAGGLAAAARILSIPKKTLDNVRRRDSIPLDLVVGIESASMGRRDDIPASATVAAKRDTVLLPRFVHWTPELMRFLGYYIAEGHSRARPGSLFQVSIAATETEIRDDVQACALRAFGATPHCSPAALTYSGRALHHLVTTTLGCGARASEKRIPAVAAGQPEELTRHLLRAYFAGDGHADRRGVASCSSISLGLLHDIGLQLSRRRIAYSLSTETRPARGVVKEFLIRMGRPLRDFTIHNLRVRATHAVRFAETIGFGLTRKQTIAERWSAVNRPSRTRSAMGDLIQDRVRSITPLPETSGFVYDIEVEEHHTFLLANGVASENCDGDEDAFMLLLDAFVNFSRTFIPDRRGGLMDLPLVLGTRIDPSEIDKEALNVDVGWRYPLEFYRATEYHPPAKNLAAKMELVGHRLGTPGQFEGFGYSVESRSIHEGPLDSRYKTLGSMPEKMAAQLALADRIRAVDAADVAARVISHNLLPDLIGNLKAFAKQSVRCTKCNSKYRRIPLGGRCTRLEKNGKDQCGNALTLTVHEASVRKYLDLALRLSEKYAIPEYTKQHILLAQKFIDDTFKMRDLKLAAFG
ncbi:MAG: DNA polymerase II large subunit [Euryarchaeota archaeon]|nr:DNA polymerase II large subunit [Euryarchaeota archaeon]